jgi:DNA-binding NtrC family response regulator
MSGAKLLLIEAGHHAGSQSQKPSLEDCVFPPGFVPVLLSARLSAESLLDAAPEAIVVLHRASRAAALDTVKRVRTLCGRIPLLLLAWEGSEEFIIEVFHAGVTRYLKFPFTTEQLNNALGARAQTTLAEGDLRGPSCLVGSSAAMCELRRYITQVAASDSNVLITGETGTGKELVAKLVHENSPRYKGPFVCLNTVAIPEALVESELFGYEKGAFTGALAQQVGKLAAANHGTVFFDEIGDVSPFVQAKLLRAIESKKIQPLGSNQARSLNVRVLAATNQDLESATVENRFRSDLYYRLNVVRIEVPALRDHVEDLPALVDHYVRHFSSTFQKAIVGLNAESLDRLYAYPWPGNIRELRNVVESTFVNLPHRQEGIVNLPAPVTKYLSRATQFNTGECAMLLRALNATNWNRTEAAKRLHWSRMTLYRKMVRYRVDAPRMPVTQFETGDVPPRN